MNGVVPPLALSVVVPVRNERENIPTLLEEIVAAVAGSGAYEIIYVDDGSDDGSEAELLRMKGRFPQLRVLRHRRCYGQSAALRSGILAARGQVIATLDGDGQNDPADIPTLLEVWRELERPGRPALIAGHRTDRKDTPWRRFSSRIANRVRCWALADDTPDTGCGLKVFSRELFLTLPYFDHMHRFLPALALRAGGVVRSVPVRHRSRLRGQSKYGTWHRLWVGIWDVLGVMWLIQRSQRPEVTELRESVPGAVARRAAG